MAGDSRIQGAGSLPPSVSAEAVVYRFDCERDDIHDIQEEYLLARITVPPGVMIWGRIGERWIPNANGRPVVAHLLRERQGAISAAIRLEELLSPLLEDTNGGG